MKKLILLISAALFLSCDKKIEIKPKETTGSVVIWTNKKGNYKINVKVDGVEAGQITGEYAGENAECGARYAVTVDNLAPGVHKVEAEENVLIGGKKWTSYAVIEAGKCYGVMLKK